jgi:hypothetical protein
VIRSETNPTMKSPVGESPTTRTAGSADDQLQGISRNLVALPQRDSPAAISGGGLMSRGEGVLEPEITA